MDVQLRQPAACLLSAWSYSMPLHDYEWNNQQVLSYILSNGFQDPRPHLIIKHVKWKNTGKPTLVLSGFAVYSLSDKVQYSMVWPGMTALHKPGH